MPLTKEDLQAIGELMDRKLEPVRKELRSEIASVRGDLKGEIASVRDDLKGEIASVRGEVTSVKEEVASVKEEITSTRTEIMSYIESHVEKEIRQIADGHKMLYEKMDREFKAVHEEIDELRGVQAAQEFVLTQRLKQG